MIKKVLPVIAFASLMASSQAFAQMGGFIDQSGSNMGTIAQLKNLPDNSALVIKGNIVRQIRGDLYEVKDNTGSVEIEIDNKYWNGQNVTSKDTLRLFVEVDKDFMHTEYEVKAPVELVRTPAAR